ncbi:MAG: lysylphosphatidylglycerol synthase domain-containing protein [Candidatus Rokuibacteriota bacterium]
MQVLRVILLAAGVVALVALVLHVGAGPVGQALATMTWWQFALICLVHGVGVLADTVGWRCTLTGDRPPFRRLLAVRCAGEAVNALTALGSVGGEATKAWLLRRDVPYQASIPSLVLAKTALVVAQALLLVVALVVGWTTGIAGPALLAAMATLLLIEVVGVGGFILVQHAGIVGKAGRLLAWAGVSAVVRPERLDDAIRDFYRREWRWFALSGAAHFAGWLVAVVEGFVILRCLALPASLAAATVLEGVGSGVRFATFFVPASLGTLEGANAVAFGAFGWGAGAGLAFTLVRRARQAVWIALGAAILFAMGAPRALARERGRPLPSGAD